MSAFKSPDGGTLPLQIVSWNNPKAYYPDPKIERNILGPVLPGYVASPNSTPKKFRSAILSPKKMVSKLRQQQFPAEEEKTKDTNAG
jgi:hypothetical protein